MEEIISLHYVQRDEVYNIRVLGKGSCDFHFPMFALSEQQVCYVLDAAFPDATIIPYNEFIKKSRKKGNGS